MKINARRVELTAKFLERASHFFGVAATEVRDANNPWGCPSIAHAMASALDAQRAAGGALDHIDPATLKTKEI